MNEIAASNEPLVTHFWTWRGYPLRYAIAGEGPPVLLLHGFGACIEHWRKNMPTLVAAGYQAIAIDLLGFGQSAKPAIDYSLDLWQEMLQDFWTENIQQPTVCIGNSIGALLGLMLVVDAPERFPGAILLNCAGGLNHRPHELNLPLRLVMGLFARAVAHPVIGKFLFDQIRQKRRIRATLNQVYCNPEAVTDELVELLYRPSCDPGAQQVFASILTAHPGPELSVLLEGLRRPILVLWGEADPWTPIRGAAIFQEYTKRRDIQVIPVSKTGHCPHDDRPEVVNPLVLAWLAAHFPALASMS